MAGANPIVYFDTCIWLAWFKKETRAPGEMDGIHEYVKRFDAGEIVIATSVVTLTEMLDLKNKLTAANLKKFQRFFYRSDVIRVAVDIRVAEITRDIRDFYFAQHLKDGLPTLELGDAVHLACAIHLRVDEFLTFDERDSKKPSKPKRGIVGLNGNVGGHRLKIIKPQPLSKQMALPLPADAKQPSEISK